jgi:hypothetical protein
LFEVFAMGGESPEKPAGYLASLDRKYWAALALYVVLAVMAWFTIGPGTTVVLGRPMEIRVVPVFVLVAFAIRTHVAMKADRIRRGSGK